MPSYFFKISTTDLSAFVNKQKYEVNREDVYEEWRDGNWVDHRVIARTRIRGKIILGFSSLTDYASFQTLLSSARTVNGSYPVSLFVNNLNAEATIEAYVDSAAAVRWDTAHGRQWVEVTLEVRQR